MTEADTITPTDHATGTDLVCLTAQVEPLEPHVQVRHNPSFVTQLIATAADLPHTRQRRRADPADAVTAYASARRPIPVRGRTGRLV